MHRPTFLLMASICLSVCHAGQTDTLTLFYGPSAYGLSAASGSRLDAFLQKGWDRLTIRSYTGGPMAMNTTCNSRNGMPMVCTAILCSAAQHAGGASRCSTLARQRPWPTTAPKKAIARSDRFTVGGLSAGAVLKIPLTILLL
jgi:hypothetical protein